MTKQRAARRQSRRTEAVWRVLAMALLAAALYCCFGGLRRAESQEETVRSVDELSYDELLEQAAVLTGAERGELYRRAVFLYPTGSKAYLQLLEQLMADGQFSAEEEQEFISVFFGVVPGRSCMYADLLREYPAEYGQVCFRLGEAYWYGRTGSVSRETGAAWYWRAWVLHNSAEKKMPELKLARWYGMLTQGQDALFRWKALLALAREEPAEKKDFWVENEIGTLVLADSGELLEKGVTPEEMEEALRMAEAYIEAGEGERKKQTEETLEKAKEALGRIRQRYAQVQIEQ